MSTQTQAPSILSSFATTITGLLSTINTTANLANRTVNTIDQYAQTVERHAEDYNYSSKLVSLKRREQLEEQFRLLSDEEKSALRSSKSPFDDFEPEESK